MKKRRETMDELDVRLLAILSEDPTQSYARVKEKVGVSIGTVYLRVNRLKEWGIIQRAQLILDPKKLGYSLVVIVRMQVADTQSAIKALEAYSNVSTAYVLSGDMNLMVHVYLKDVSELDELLERFRRELKAERSDLQIVLSEPIRRGVPLPVIGEKASQAEAKTNGSTPPKKRQSSKPTAASSKKK